MMIKLTNAYKHLRVYYVILYYFTLCYVTLG